MAKELKIIQIIDSLAVGGAEMIAVNIANGLADRGISSHLCTTRAEGILKAKLSSNVPYLFLAKRKACDLKAFVKLLEYIKINKITIAHIHSTSVFFCFLLKFFSPKLKLIWHNHTGANTKLITNFKYQMLKFVVKSYDIVINVSKDLNEWSVIKLRFKNSKFLPNFFKQNDLKMTSLKLKSSYKIVIVAALRKEKDHLNLLKAFKKIKEKYSNWSLHIIGAIPKNITTDIVIDYIKKNKLDDSVFLYGAVMDITHVLSQADIGVLSSSSEGLPVSLLEYGAAGLPVVVTDVGECKSVVNNCGLVIEKQNSKELYLAIEKYIIDIELRKIMSKNFKKHIDNHYSENSYFEKLITMYKLC